MTYMLHSVFLDSVTKFGHRIAIEEEEGQTITYQALDMLSNRFANCFEEVKKGKNPSPYVGILSSVNSASIAAVLGCLKMGCAYVPLDEHAPSERLLHIIISTGLDTLVIDSFWAEKHKELLKHPQLKRILFLNEHFQDFAKNGELKPYCEHYSNSHPQVSDSLAYILHTSGSTGIPKGIMLTHRNARTFVDWMHKEFQVTCDDIVMSRAPFKFDLSVFDIFNTFKAGAKLVCYQWNKKREEGLKHNSYVKLMERTKATILYTTPSTFISLMNHGGLGETKLNLSRIMYAGEPFFVPQLQKLMRLLPNTQIANIYGPTETNIITYYWIDHVEDFMTSIPLGYVVDDTEILVVREDLKSLCAIGEIGELWCRGGTVTLGYLGMPEKTKECLVQSPFHSYPCYFWRTGDFGFLDEKGVLHYRGRRDHMVKVKGYRIEIGEIEQVLAKHESLDEYAVVAIPDEKYGNRLFCYYTCLPGKTLETEELKHYVGLKLPEYFVPYQFIRKQEMPKTSSGKIDRVLLAQGSKHG